MAGKQRRRMEGGWWWYFCVAHRQSPTLAWMCWKLVKLNSGLDFPIHYVTTLTAPCIAFQMIRLCDCITYLIVLQMHMACQNYARAQAGWLIVSQKQAGPRPWIVSHINVETSGTAYRVSKKKLQKPWEWMWQKKEPFSGIIHVEKMNSNPYLTGHFDLTTLITSHKLPCHLNCKHFTAGLLKITILKSYQYRDMVGDTGGKLNMR